MSRASQHLQRVFARRYMTAFVLLACVATATFVISFRLTSIEKERAHVLILATEQRALSQRIAFLVKGMDETRDPVRAEELRIELDATIGRMRQAHRVLSGESKDDQHLARFTKPLQEIYHGGHIPFASRTTQFLENARIIAATNRFSSEWDLAEPLREEIVRSATNSMMQTHGLMVMILEAEARRDNTLSKWVDLTSWLSILAMLMVVTFVIFRPMRREIVSAVVKVEGEKSRADSAEAKAIAANKARGAFFQSASHELRTPLNAILGMSDVIREKEIDEIEQEVEQISAAGDHLLALLNNILDAHKLSQGQLKTEDKPFSLDRTMGRVSALAQSLAEEKHLQYESEVDIPTDLIVDGDSARLEQILVNIVDNAAKFTEQGTVSLVAHVDKNNPGRAGLHVAVSDTGIGIPPEQLDQILNRDTADQAALARNGGLGIGLSVAKELAELMGGSIDIQSTVGKGTRILIAIPFAIKVAESGNSIAVESAQSETPSAEAESASPPVFFGGKRSFKALVVDDNMANRMVAEALLKPLGAETETAVDGRQAVAKAEAELFDIIFMDISMPVMDGIEATIEIRAGTGASRKTPIIALTAHVDVDEFETLRGHGFQDIITKPVRKDTLSRALHRWLPDSEEWSEEVA
ncbi:MAG: ATP-binding protein [Parvularcula sp.]